MQKVFLCLIIFILAISGSGGGLKAAEENLFDQALEARGKGDNEKALEILEQCVEEGIEVHRAYFEMGKILLEQGKYRRAFSVSEKAIKAYEEYLKNHPQDHNAWWELGYIYEVRSDYSKEWNKAQEALEKAVELVPSSSFYLLHLGWVYYRKGDNEKAEEAFEKILDKNPEDFQARYFLASTLIDAERQEEAKQELTYILENCPKEEVAYSWAKDKWKELEESREQSS